MWMGCLFFLESAPRFRKSNFEGFPFPLNFYTFSECFRAMMSVNVESTMSCEEFVPSVIVWSNCVAHQASTVSLVVHYLSRSARTRVVCTLCVWSSTTWYVLRARGAVDFAGIAMIRIYLLIFWLSLLVYGCIRALLRCGKWFVSSTTSQTTVAILTMSVYCRWMRKVFITIKGGPPVLIALVCHRRQKEVLCVLNQSAAIFDFSQPPASHEVAVWGFADVCTHALVCATHLVVYTFLLFPEGKLAITCVNLI